MASSNLFIILTITLLSFTVSFATVTKDCGPTAPKHRKPTPSPKPYKPPTYPTKPTPSPKPYHPPTYPTPSPKPYQPPATANCPIDTVKIGACANVLNGLLTAVLGTPPKESCCSLVQNVADLELAACLCTVVKATVPVLGVTLNVPVSLTLLANYCGKDVPQGFVCK